MRPGRRRFLQVGIAGVAVLAAARLLERPAPDAPMVEALAAVILDGALPPEREARAAALRQVAASVEGAIAGLDPAAREEVAQLFALLRFAPTRYLLTGVAAPLERATPQDIAVFLERWRASRFDLLRAGYQGLTQLVQAGWYDEPRSWAFVGYPGPPPLGAT
jgi:hypothetical protein